MDDFEQLAEFCVVKFDEIVAVVSAMNDRTVNAVPSVAGGNSVFAITTHCAGMMRKWSSTVSRGIEIPRDRDAEFVAAGSVAELLEVCATARAGFVADVAQLDGVDPPADSSLVEDDDWWGVNVHGIVLHIFEELCQHLGHIEITRDVVAG